MGVTPDTPWGRWARLLEQNAADSFADLGY